MDRSQALLQIAEIAVALAGFGGIFVALSRERGRERRPADTYRLIVLLSTALCTLLLSLIPVALLSLQPTDDVIWPIASASTVALVTTLLVVTGRYRSRYRQEIREGEFARAANVVWGLAAVMLVAQLANAVGLFGDQAFGVFLCGLIFLVAFGAYLFARMLFLWRS